jgi:plasmid stability protein
MATLYVENVPDDLYEALRSRAKAHRRSIAAEVVALLKENVPTEEELQRRKDLFNKLCKIRSTPTPEGKVFPTAEEMIREDRER